MTRKQKITRAIVAMTLRKSQDWHTLANLIVECWLADREAFGLAEYWREHPCSKTVAAELYGKFGLVTCGLLETQMDGGRLMVRATDKAFEALGEIRPLEAEKECEVVRV